MSRYWCLLFGAMALPGQSVVISQIYGGGGNTGALYRNDFVELFNRGTEPVSVAGWSVQYASATGTAWQAAAIDGVIEPGRYYLVQLAAGTGGTQALPAADATGPLALGATAGKIALVRNVTPLNEAAQRPFVQDLVGYGLTATEFKGAPVRDLSNTTAAIRGGAGCVDTGNNQNDFAIGAPAPRNRGTAVNDCRAAPVPAVRLKISEIQGSGDASPFADQRVVTRGVVYARRTNGFYIQSLAGDEDGDAATSEGLLVFTGSAAPASAAVGAVVDVEGLVTEFKPASDLGSPTLTELTAPAVTVLSTGQALPTPVVLTGEEWERFEGMRVSAALTVVGPTGGTFNETSGSATSNGVFWGVLGGPRPFRRPGLSGEDTTGRLRVDTRALGGAGIEVVPGDSASVAGALDFGFRTYTVLNEGALVLVSKREVKPLPAAATGEFTIGTLNLERFFEAATAFPTRLAKLKLYVQNVLRSPDILAVQEVGNQAALDRVAAELGGYRAFVGRTNDISGIAPGFLMKTATVTVLSTASIPDPDQIHDRPPFRLDARIGNQRLALLCVHNRSLNDIEDVRVQTKRRAQAESINATAKAIASENIPFAILGDFNAFPFDDGYADLLPVIGNGLDLTSINALLKNGDNYSYVFNGATQALDHILLSPGMRQWITRAAYAGGNADFPESARADATTPFRVSDHDAAMIWVRFEATPFTALSIANAASFQTGSIAAGEILTVFGRDLNGTRFTIDGKTATPVYQSATQWSVAAPLDLRTSGTVEVAFERNGQKVHAVEMPVAPSAPALFNIRPIKRRGEIVELWGTGAGMDQTTTARVCGLPAEVLYSGQAPGFVAGAWQVNVRIPMGCPAGASTLEVSAGARTSPDIAITIQ